MTAQGTTTTATLVRMRLTVWRRTPSTMRGFGVTLGVLAAGWTIVVGLGRWGDPSASGALLSVALLLWLVGWLIGPLQSGRGDVLDPQWFALLPGARRLAPRLVLAGCVGTGAAVTLLASLSLAALGARGGVVPAAVGLLAAFPWTIVLVTASRLVGGGLRAAARRRLTTEIIAAQWGMFIAALTVGWFAVWPVLGRLGSVSGHLSVPDGVATLLRVLPSGWGVVAVESAAAGQWPLVLLTLAGLVALSAAAIWTWGVLLQRQLTSGGATAVRRPRRSASTVLPPTPLGAVVYRDVRTWSRDPRRGIEIRSAIWAGVFATAALWIAEPAVASFAGVFVTLIGAMSCVNVYAMDGTALWHSLVTPGALRVDVRGRQLAWLMAFTPVAVATSGPGLVVTQAWWALPWVLALLLALLGGAAGLIPLLSVVALAPETEPHKRGANPTETGADATGLYILMLVATLTSAVPAGAVLAVAVATQQQSVAWLAVAVGAVTGGGLTWGLGVAAGRRLESRGPELLQLMRTGTPVAAARDSAAARASAPAGGRAAWVWLRGPVWTVAMVALVPQGLLPLVLLAVGDSDARTWFLALYVPSPWSYAAAVIFVLLGIATIVWAARKERDLSGTPDEE